MTSEITYVESYLCPRCQAELEAPPGYGSMWLACPQCGRVALPPEAVTLVPRPAANEDIVFIGPEDGQNPPPLYPVRPKRRPFSPWRIFLLFGLVVSVFGVVEAFMSQETVRAAVFGVGLLVFLGLMTYPSKPGRD